MSDRHACPFRGCRCSHDSGCVAGWLDDLPADDAKRARTAPCPNCRPEIAQHLAQIRRQGTDPDALTAARGQLRHLARSSRGAA